MSKVPSNRDDLGRTLALVSQLGFVVLACILGGFGLGLYLDRLFGTFPVLLIVFLLAGIAGGFWRAYVLAMKATQ